MIRVRMLACVLPLAFSAASCDKPASPPVAVRQTALDADDIAVMRGLLDDLIRPEQVDSIRRGRAPGAPPGPIEPRFLVVDTTIAVCDRDLVVFGPPPGGCLAPGWITLVSQALPPGTARTATLAFASRNARRIPITASIGRDVTFVSSTVTDFVEMNELLRQHPPGSAVVSFSVPSYPGPRMAVLAFNVRNHRAGAARLAQQDDSRWTVADLAGGIE